MINSIFESTTSNTESIIFITESKQIHKPKGIWILKSFGGIHNCTMKIGTLISIVV
jgi:hypothetical protein